MGVELLNIKGLSELDPAAPVVMLNLMRFREHSLNGDGSGWDAYLRYSALTVPMIKARGGTLLWTGNAEAVALGGSRQSMGLCGAGVLPVARRVHRHDDIAGLRKRKHPHRRNGCAEHVIICTHQAYSKSSPVIYNSRRYNVTPRVVWRMTLRSAAT